MGKIIWCYNLEYSGDNFWIFDAVAFHVTLRQKRSYSNNLHIWYIETNFVLSLTRHLAFCCYCFFVCFLFVCFVCFVCLYICLFVYFFFLYFCLLELCSTRCNRCNRGVGSDNSYSSNYVGNENIAELLCSDLKSYIYSSSKIDLSCNWFDKILNQLTSDWFCTYHLPITLLRKRCVVTIKHQNRFIGLNHIRLNHLKLGKQS